MDEREKPLIVVGVDGSGPGGVALERALAEAEIWDADLHVVYVSDIPPGALYLTDSIPIDVSELARIQREGVWEVVGPIIESSSRAIEKVDLDGYPADRLVEYCETSGAALLVLGTRGRGRIAATFLGSTSLRAMEHAPCDVLIAKRRTD
jgi:nucleotide-binding universal stress UspA family protein